MGKGADAVRDDHSAVDDGRRARRTLIVVPAFNEEQSIAAVLAEVRRHLPDADLLVVDDGSSDATVARAGAAGAPVLELPFNLGVGGAMRAGFRYARDNGYDCVVQVDADGQHDPASAHALLAALAHGADVVVGSRFAGAGRFEVRPARRLAMRLVSRLTSLLVGTRLTDATSGFRASSRRAVELFAQTYPAEYFGDTLDSLVIARRTGLTIAEVPVVMRPRASGEPSQGWFATILYLSRCALALAIRKQDPVERSVLRGRVAG